MSTYESGNLDDIFAMLEAEKKAKKRKHSMPERTPSALERNQEIIASNQISDVEKIAQIDELIEQVKLEAQRKLELIRQLQNGLEVSGSRQLGDSQGMPTKFENGSLLASSNHALDWQEITVGELLTDSEWQDKGLSYSINASKIPLDICQQYVEYWSQVELRKLVDDRTRASLEIDETANTYTRNIASKEIQDRQQHIEHFGQKVEIMVKNFIEKMSIDQGFEVKVEFGDIKFDYEYKIDLVITIKDRRRGVIINQAPHEEKIGIQLTILTRAEELAIKEQKAENTWKWLLSKGLVDDVAFVSLDAHTSGAMKQAYEQWLSDITPGGPDKLLPMQTKEDLFKALFTKMMSQEEIDELWQKYQSAM